MEKSVWKSCYRKDAADGEAKRATVRSLTMHRSSESTVYHPRSFRNVFPRGKWARERVMDAWSPSKSCSHAVAREKPTSPATSRRNPTNVTEIGSRKFDLVSVCSSDFMTSCMMLALGWSRNSDEGFVNHWLWIVRFREDFEFLFWYRGLMGNFNDPSVEIFSIYFN